MGIQGHITLPSSGYVANNNIDYFNFYFVLDDWAVKGGISYTKKPHDDVSDPNKGYWKLFPTATTLTINPFCIASTLVKKFTSLKAFC